MEERLTALETKVAEVIRRLDALCPQPAAQTTKAASDDSNWQRSIAFSLQWEGGRNFTVVDGKPVVKGYARADLGGATAYGIIVPTLQAAHAAGIVPHGDITKLTQDEAKAIYRQNFWLRYGWDKVAWPACLCCLDISINHSPKGMALILQRAVADCGQKVDIDGKFGPKTFAAAQACDPVALAKAIVKRRGEYYEAIIKANASQECHRRGWFNRLTGMAQAAGVA